MRSVWKFKNSQTNLFGSAVSGFERVQNLNIHLGVLFQTRFNLGKGM